MKSVQPTKNKPAQDLYLLLLSEYLQQFILQFLSKIASQFSFNSKQKYKGSVFFHLPLAILRLPGYVSLSDMKKLQSWQQYFAWSAVQEVWCMPPSAAISFD